MKHPILLTRTVVAQSASDPSPQAAFHLVKISGVKWISGLRRSSMIAGRILRMLLGKCESDHFWYLFTPLIWSLNTSYIDESIKLDDNRYAEFLRAQRSEADGSSNTGLSFTDIQHSDTFSGWDLPSQSSTTTPRNSSSPCIPMAEPVASQVVPLPTVTALNLPGLNAFMSQFTVDTTC